MSFSFFKQKYPFHRQIDQSDCGPSCLKMIAEHYGRTLNIHDLREKCKRTKGGVTFGALSDAAEDIGFKSLGVAIDFNTLKEDAPLPCIAQWKQRHLIVINDIKTDYVIITDPLFGTIKYRNKVFIQGWVGKDKSIDSDGAILLLEPTPEFYESENYTDRNKKGFAFLLPYFKPYKKFTTQIILSLFIGSLIQLIFPFLTQAVVDFGITNQDIDFIYLIFIAQSALFISQAGINIIRSWLLLHLSSRVNISLLSNYLQKLMRMPISFFDSRIPGDLYRRIEDNTRIESFISSSSFSSLFSAITFLIFSTVLAIYNLTIFTVFLFGSLLYIAWILAFLKARKTIDFMRFDENAGNSSNLIQLIYGMQEIKLNNSEKRRRWEWESIRVRLYKVAVKGMRLTQIQESGGNIINEFKNIVISFFAAKLVVEGEITLGMMLAIQYINGQLNVPLSNFIPLIRQGQDAQLSLNRIAEIYEEEDEAETDNDKIDDVPLKKDLIFKNVSFQYGTKSSEYILKNLNITFPAGRTTAIVGASGSGKTTLLKLLLKIYSPQKGNILIGNTGFDNFSTRSWRNECGVVMQEGFIFSDTVLKNITESDPDNKVNQERLEMAVSISNASEFIERLPGGYNTRIGGSGIQLSGGQKQRILIARAIYKNPKFLFFDEATSALDSNNEKIIIENLESYLEDRTVIVIAHRLSTVRNADQILVLDSGEIIERGTHEELTNLNGAYYTLIKNQLELGQ